MGSVESCGAAAYKGGGVGHHTDYFDVAEGVCNEFCLFAGGDGDEKSVFVKIVFYVVKDGSELLRLDAEDDYVGGFSEGFVIEEGFDFVLLFEVFKAVGFYVTNKDVLWVVEFCGDYAFD